MTSSTPFVNSQTNLLSWIPSSQEGDKIINKLPSKFKTGTVWMDEGDTQLYLSVYVCSVIFFFGCYFFLKWLFTVLKIQQFIRRDEAARIRYVSLWQNNIHHGLIFMISIYNMYWSCSNSDGQPWPSDKGGSYSKPSDVKHWGWWKNDECMMEVNKGYMYILMIAIGFLSTDLVILKYFFKDTNKLNQQTIWHHYFVIAGFLASIFAGYNFVGIANASLLCEISGIFLDYKDMVPIAYKNHWLAQINQVLFLITYTLFRMIPFPFLTIKCFSSIFALWHLVGWFRAMMMIICTINAFLLTLLQFYWYKLIMKGLKRMLQEKGILAPSSNPDEYKDVDELEEAQQVQLADIDQVDANEKDDDFEKQK